MQTASTKDVVFLCLSSVAASLLVVLVLHYDDLRLVILEESLKFLAKGHTHTQL